MIYYKIRKTHLSLKAHFDPFLFIQKDFLQHMTRGIISGIIAVDVQGESR